MIDIYSQYAGLLVSAWAQGFYQGLFIAVVFAAVRLITYR